MVTGELLFRDGVEHYRIDGVEHMDPFLTTVVSDTDLWMFVSSSGALTAGRVDADHALLPYMTDDRLHRGSGVVGPVTVIARTVDGNRALWKPFAAETDAACRRSMEKSVVGERLVLAEHHTAWDLELRVTWSPSSTYGWVRSVELVDLGGIGAELEVLDGLVDVMPAGIDARTEQLLSNLVDSYKRSEAGPWGSLAIYTVESLITDRAEPAESLTATTVWSTGFPGAVLDLDGRSVSSMIEGRLSDPRELVTGRPGAYLLRGPLTVPASGSVAWMMVADTDMSQGDVLDAVEVAGAADAAERVGRDIDSGSERLRALLAAADGFQTTADRLADAHHLSNVLFNSMRGGVFPNGHRIPTSDLVEFVRGRNQDVADRCATWLSALDEWVEASELRDAAHASSDADLIRLVLEYLPLTFSRRHGDPSRPWNRFSINVHDDEGGELLSYEGNWRDIFQNWEALLQSFPAYYSHVVAKFVNASTLDGHNPYRISRDGVDWEVHDPDDPWSNIGYWGDHQIVYLLRLLEAWEDHEPGAIGAWLRQSVFVYADVPYNIVGHRAMIADPRSTIVFDEPRAAAIERREEQIGSDGRLVVDADGELLRVGFAEKLLVPALAKLSSFVPEGGIWLNTQRPEWNDANNALAGPGLSMVTLYHLDRYLRFVAGHFEAADSETVPLTSSVAGWTAGLLGAFEGLSPVPETIDDAARRTVLDTLATVGSEHRARIAEGVDSTTVDVPTADVRRLCALATEWLAHSIRGARRPDGLYHSYNRLSFPTGDTARVDHLDLMLEGQVAVLSSGALDPEAAMDLVDSLFASAMYRPDQQTFMLYPVVELPSFPDRNIVPADAVASVPGLSVPLDGSMRRIFSIDSSGRLRFRPEAVNVDALRTLFDHAELPAATRDAIAALYEEVFHHSSFTGRSGSMYGYEGIGSVYWHMVAKLLLAVQETYWSAAELGAPPDQMDRLADAYSRVRSGLGYKKTPQEYGAFPTDCYSHTPAHAGAQQPGMTGQVKEEVLTRWGELGLRVVGGCLSMSPGLVPLSEIVPVDGADGPKPAAFTFCAVPMTIERGERDEVTVVGSDGVAVRSDGLTLTRGQSEKLFARDGSVDRVEWTLGPLVARSGHS